MDIDVIIDSHLDSAGSAELGLLAEKYGLRAIWNSSYLDGRDPFTNLAELARRSRSIRIGPIALNPYELHPFRIGMALLTLNELCPGRAQTVIGGGGEVVMALGIPPERRVRAVRECIDIVRGMLTERPFSYSGELFRIDGYDPQWPVAGKPMVYAAANRPQMLRMAAHAADGIMMSDLSPTLAAGAIDAVRRQLSALGRDPGEFRFSNFMAWYVYDDAAEARREARRWIGYRALFREYMMREFMSPEEFETIRDFVPQIYEMAARGTDSVPGLDDRLIDLCVDRLTLTGDPGDLDRIIEHLLELKAVGVTEIALELRKHPEKSIRMLGEIVAPALR